MAAGPESGDGEAAAAAAAMRVRPSGLVTMSWNTASLSSRSGLLTVLAMPASTSVLSGCGRLLSAPCAAQLLQSTIDMGIGSGSNHWFPVNVGM